MPIFATPLRVLLTDAVLPADFQTAFDAAFVPILDKVSFTDYGLFTRPDGMGLTIELVLEGEAAISLPGLDGFGLFFNSDQAGSTLIDASCFIGPRGFSGQLDNIVIALRIPSDILAPAPEVPGADLPPYAQIT